MIKFNALVEAIYEAAVAANRALVSENIRLLSDEYFERTEGEKPLSGSLDAAIAQANAMLEQDGVDKAAVEALIRQLKGARDAAQQTGSATKMSEGGGLTPKTVDVIFPALTAEGVIEKTVKVPLIALVPVTTPEISELRMTTPLEVSEDGVGLNVTFPSRAEGRDMKDGEAVRTNWSTLEIVVRPADGPAALKSLIEGYEKVLRAQIP